MACKCLKYPSFSFFTSNLDEARYCLLDRYVCQPLLTRPILQLSWRESWHLKESKFAVIHKFSQKKIRKSN